VDEYLLSTINSYLLSTTVDYHVPLLDVGQERRVKWEMRHQETLKRDLDSANETYKRDPLKKYQV